MEDNAMKHTKKQTLWYNPVERDARDPLGEDGIARLAGDREGRALLESYCRLYRKTL